MRAKLQRVVQRHFRDRGLDEDLHRQYVELADRSFDRGVLALGRDDKKGVVGAIGDDLRASRVGAVGLLRKIGLRPRRRCRLLLLPDVRGARRHLT